MEGYIWYCSKIYSGTRSEYLKFCEEFGNTELVMKVQITSEAELQRIADNLNHSNFLDALKDRFGGEK